MIGQAADTSQSQACYWEFFLHHLNGSKCLNYLPTFGDLCFQEFLSVLSCFAFSGKDNNVEEGEVKTAPPYTGVEVELNIEEDEEDYDYDQRRRRRH